MTLPSIQKTNVVAGGVTADVTLVRVTSHSAPITGTFKLSVGGEFLTSGSTQNLPYNIEGWQLASAMREMYGDEISVSRVQNT